MNINQTLNIEAPIINALLQLDLDKIRAEGRSTEVLRQFVEIAETMRDKLQEET